MQMKIKLAVIVAAVAALTACGQKEEAVAPAADAPLIVKIQHQ